jgi:hypothetical protein
MSLWKWSVSNRLYLNGYIGKLATGPGLVFFMRDQLGKPIPSGERTKPWKPIASE